MNKKQYLFYTFLAIAIIGAVYLIGSITPIGYVVKSSVTTCADNDEGDIYIKGTLQLERNGNIVHEAEDSCWGDNKVVQYYCIDDSYSKIFGAITNLKGSEVSNCEEGCIDGACIEPTQEEPRPTPPTDPEVGDPEPIGLTPGDHTFEISLGPFSQRTYHVHIPQSYDGTPRPAVLLFHGGGGDAETIITQSHMNRVADEENFITIYPEGTGVFGLQTWNAGDCCGYASDHNIDDVGFVNAVLDDIEARTPIDIARIYATGHSNGGHMAYRLACDMSERIAAVASNAGHGSVEPCNPPRSVPVMHVHGTADPIALYEGGTCGTKDTQWDCNSVEEYVASWANVNGCSTEPTTQTVGSSQKITYQGCTADTLFFKMADAGHTWPGGDYAVGGRWWKNTVGPISNDIDASEEMWDFFKAHSLN